MLSGSGLALRAWEEAFGRSYYCVRVCVGGGGGGGLSVEDTAVCV